MSSDRDLIPETRVLAIASHVVYGYVGNKIATFVMQALGCDVSALNTVNYSNHTGYKQIKGTKTSADEIWDLYQGLKDSHLIDFDMMLSGYLPSAEAVEAVARIGRELRLKATTKPGSFFWVLDPVLGDNGKLYVPETEVAAYKLILRDCDLILPNQFELETLTGVTITNQKSLLDAIAAVHREYQLPHVFVTSTKLEDAKDGTIALVGSTADSTLQPRLFRIDVPYFPVYFTGTGDMFAALLVARLREEAKKADLDQKRHWLSSDDVAAVDLPLAKAAERVVASMQAVLRKTHDSYLSNKHAIEEEARKEEEEGEERDEEIAKLKHLRSMKAVELQIVRNVADLLHPPDPDHYKAYAPEI